MTQEVLEQEIYKMSPEHLIVLENKNVAEVCQRDTKAKLKNSLRPKLVQFEHQNKD